MLHTVCSNKYAAGIIVTRVSHLPDSSDKGFNSHLLNERKAVEDACKSAPVASKEGPGELERLEENAVFAKVGQNLEHQPVDGARGMQRVERGQEQN